MRFGTAPVFPSWYGLTCRPSDLATSDVGPWPSVDLPGEPAPRPEPEPYTGPPDPDLDF